MTPEAKQKMYQQLSQSFPEEAIERTDAPCHGQGLFHYRYKSRHRRDARGGWRRLHAGAFVGVPGFPFAHVCRPTRPKVATAK
jgi:hypothetical protein